MNDSTNNPVTSFFRHIASHFNFSNDPKKDIPKISIKKPAENQEKTPHPLKNTTTIKLVNHNKFSGSSSTDDYGSTF